jgi:DNA-binding CsgD family transcriptional regulator
MSRVNDLSISESLETLDSLIASVRDDSARRRLEMLRMLKECGRQPVELAVALQVDERTIRRWITRYEEGGLEALLPNSSRSLDLDNPDLIEMVSAAMVTGQAVTLHDIRDLIKLRSGISPSLPTIAHWIEHRLLLRRSWTPINDGTAPPPPISKAIPDKVLEFLNSLPVTIDTRTWLVAFKQALSRLLGDVDLISIDINTDCDLRFPDEYATDIVVSQHFDTTGRGQSRVSICAKEATRTKALVNEMRRSGFPLERYHLPTSFEYTLGTKAHVGTILLFRERERPPIEAATIELMKSLEACMVFILTDCIARRRRVEVVESAFVDVFAGIADTHQLTTREREVLVLQLIGKSYKEISGILCVTVDAVRNNVKNVHRKTGCSSNAELFGKFFTAIAPEQRRSRR